MDLEHDFEALFDENESNGPLAVAAPPSVPNGAKSSQNSGVPMEISDVCNGEDFTLEPENPKQGQINSHTENSLQVTSTTTIDKVLADIKDGFNGIRKFASSFDPELLSHLNEFAVTPSPTTNAPNSIQLSYLVKVKFAFDGVNEIFSEVDSIREQLGIPKCPQVALMSPDRTSGHLAPPRTDQTALSPIESVRHADLNGRKNRRSSGKKDGGDEMEVLNQSTEIFGGSPEKSPRNSVLNFGNVDSEKKTPLVQKKPVFHQDRLFVESPAPTRRKSSSRPLTAAAGGKPLSCSRTKELYRAVKNDEVDTVRKLLEAREDPNVPYSADKQAPFPLHGAARADNQETVQLLLDHGADVNKVNQDKGASALHLAAAAGFSEVVELLLRHGASKALQNIEGHTALDVASQKEVREILTGWDEKDLKLIVPKKVDHDPFSAVPTNSTYGKARSSTTATKSRPSSSNEKSGDEDLSSVMKPSKELVEPSSKASNSSQKKTLGGRKLSRSGKFSQPRSKKGSDGPFASEKLPSTIKAKKSVVVEHDDSEKPPSPFDFHEAIDDASEKNNRSGRKSKPTASTPKKSLVKVQKEVFSPGESDFDEEKSVVSVTRKQTKPSLLKKSTKDQKTTMPGPSVKGKPKSAKREHVSSDEETVSKTKRTKSAVDTKATRTDVVVEEETKKSERERPLAKLDKKKSKVDTGSTKNESVKSPRGKKKVAPVDGSDDEESGGKKDIFSKLPVKNTRVKKSTIASSLTKEESGEKTPSKVSGNCDQDVEGSMAPPKKSRAPAATKKRASDLPSSEEESSGKNGRKASTSASVQSPKKLGKTAIAEEILEEIPVSIKNPEVFVALSSTVPADVRAKFVKVADAKGWKHCTDWEQGVTHLAAASVDGKPDLCKRTVKLLNAMLDCAFIIKTEWLTACVAAKKIVPEKDFVFAGTVVGGEKGGPARAIKSLQKEEPRLFSGFNVFLKGDFKKAIKKEEFEQMVELGGGKILHTEPTKRSLAKSGPIKKPHHSATGSFLSRCSHLVVTETPVTAQDLLSLGVANVPSSWILDCIELYQLQEIAVPETKEENSV